LNTHRYEELLVYAFTPLQNAFFRKLKKKRDATATAVVKISFMRMTRKEKTQESKFAASVNMKTRNE